MSREGAAAPLAVRARGVGVSYAETRALDGVDLEVAAGRVVGLIGMNGSGKSTLFKALMGLVGTDGGTIELFGASPARARRALRVAYSPQSEDVDWDFPVSVADVVMMGRYGQMGWRRHPRQADWAAVGAALERCQLTELSQRQIGALSGGQRKRAFLARGLAQGADLLFLDEPFAGVDKRSEATITALLRELAAEGRTILVSTHDLVAVPALCDEVALINRRVIAQGPPAETLVPDLLAEAFGGFVPREALDLEGGRRVTEVASWLTDPLQYEFMQRALLVAFVVGLSCALLSCWLVLLRWSLMGDAVSHAVLPGVVLSYVVGAPFAIGAFLFGTAAVGLIGSVSRTTRIKEDAAIGVVFTALFALGIVLVSVIPSQVDLFHILFGNVLGVSDSDIRQVVVLGGLTVAVLLVFWRSFVLFAFDPTHAHAIGISPRRWEVLLLMLLALTVIVALQAVGIVLVVAMLITPGATAYLLTDRFDLMLAIAATVGVASTVLGTYLSYHLDASTGGSIVCVLASLFALAYLFAPRYGLLGQRRRGRAAATPLAGA